MMTLQVIAILVEYIHARGGLIHHMSTCVLIKGYNATFDCDLFHPKNAIPLLLCVYVVFHTFSHCK